MPEPFHEPTREVAAAILVGTCGRLLLQQRDDVPGILYPGLVGLFGGHREGNETLLETVRREVEEETSLAFPPECFEHLVDFHVAYAGGGGVTASYYVLRNVPIADVVVTEGSALVIDRSELPRLLHRMTPSACYVARLFIHATS